MSTPRFDVCKNCDTPYSEGALFCLNCNAAVDKSSDSNKISTFTYVSKSRKRKKRRQDKRKLFRVTEKTDSGRAETEATDLHGNMPPQMESEVFTEVEESVMEKDGLATAPKLDPSAHEGAAEETNAPSLEPPAPKIETPAPVVVRPIEPAKPGLLDRFLEKVYNLAGRAGTLIEESRSQIESSDWVKQISEEPMGEVFFDPSFRFLVISVGLFMMFLILLVLSSLIMNT
jgi:hypothetical protein